MSGQFGFVRCAPISDGLDLHFHAPLVWRPYVRFSTLGAPVRRVAAACPMQNSLISARRISRGCKRAI